MTTLVLTGLESLWPDHEKDSLYLGLWCFAFNKKCSFFDSNQFQIVPIQENNKEKDFLTNEYLYNLGCKIIPKLVIYLNQFQPTPLSEKFWKAYTQTWLTHWLGVMYSRFNYLSSANKFVSNHKKTIVYTPEVYSRLTSYSSDHSFMDLSSCSHTFNLVLFSDILKTIPFDNLEVIPQNIDLDISEQKHLKPKKSYLKTHLSSFKRKIISSIFLGSNFSLGDVYGISFWDKLYFHFILDPLFLFRKRSEVKLVSDQSPAHKDNLNNGSDTINIDPNSPFETLIEKLIVKYLPDYFFHNYTVNSPTQLWIGSDFYNAQSINWHLADHLSRNKLWFSSQHGGGYGHCDSLPLGNMEYKNSDGFITWGWEKHGDYHCQFIPLPSPKLSKLKTSHHKVEKILYIAKRTPPYEFRMESGNYPNLNFKYHFNQIQLIQNLPQTIRSQIVFRPYIHNYGIDECVHLKKHFPQIQIHRNKKIEQEMSEAKLILIDYIGTSMIEALTLNIPTLFLIPEEDYKLSPTAIPYFSQLEKAGILFRTPEQIANKITEVYLNPTLWWNADAIQFARKSFCEKYGLTNHYWKKEWLTFIKSKLVLQSSPSPQLLAHSEEN